jgi:DNA-binding transcriptional LysR family regulator
LRKEAPHTELVHSAVAAQTFDDVAAGRIDLNLCAEEVPPALKSEVIFNLDFVCLVGSKRRVRPRQFSLKQHLDLPHAMILTGDGHQAMGDRPLAVLGLKRARRIEDSVFYSSRFCDRADRSSSHRPPHVGEGYRPLGRFADD